MENILAQEKRNKTKFIGITNGNFSIRDVIILTFFNLCGNKNESRTRAAASKPIHYICDSRFLFIATLAGAGFYVNMLMLCLHAVTP